MESDKIKVYECDMHCHTNRSDGNDSPKELVDLAASRGMKVIAVTDHDMVPPDMIHVDGVQRKLVDYGCSRGVQIVPGIEISCDTQTEDVHIVALGCDWTHPFFRELEQKTISSKVRGYRELVVRLQADGMRIGWEELLYNKGNPIPEGKLQKKRIFEVLAEKGYVESWQAAKLMVKKTEAYNVKREKPDAVYVIAEIHKSGGIAILAHPFLFSEPVFMDGQRYDRFAYIEKLIEAGLDGIEACYTYDKTSYDGEADKVELEHEVWERYGNKVKIISGGSDYHGDEKKGVKNPRMIGECGISYSYFKNNIAPYI